MRKDTPILDFANPGVKRLAKQHIDTLVGLHWFECRKVRDQRTLSQNAYLWGLVYPAVAAGMSEAWGETLTSDDAHEFCKDRFLKRPIVNRKTGEVCGYTTPSTASLDTKECAEYIDKIVKFAGEYLHVEIPEALPSRARSRREEVRV